MLLLCQHQTLSHVVRHVSLIRQLFDQTSSVNRGRGDRQIKGVAVFDLSIHPSRVGLSAWLTVTIMLLGPKYKPTGKWIKAANSLQIKQRNQVSGKSYLIPCVRPNFKCAF